MLEQRVHRHDEEARHGADQDHEAHREPDLVDEHHRDHDDAHHHAERNHAHRAVERDPGGGEYGADGDAHGGHALQDGRLRQVEMQRNTGPLDDDELQRRARAPEKRRHRERDLAEAVFPQVGDAAAEVGDRIERVRRQVLQDHAGARHFQVEERRDGVHHDDDGDRRLARRIDAGVDERKVEVQKHSGHPRVQQHAAEHRAEDDRGDGEPLDPAVRQHELPVRQVFCEDAVLRRRISRRAQPDHGVRGKRIDAPEHEHAADDLHAVGKEHHLTFGQAVGKRARVRREQHVGDDEEELEVRREP